MERCTRIYKDGKIVDLTEEDRNLINSNNTALAKKAMRNLAFAFKYTERASPVKKG